MAENIFIYEENQCSSLSHQKLVDHLVHLQMRLRTLEVDVRLTKKEITIISDFLVKQSL